MVALTRREEPCRQDAVADELSQQALAVKRSFVTKSKKRSAVGRADHHAPRLRSREEFGNRTNGDTSRDSKSEDG